MSAFTTGTSTGDITVTMTGAAGGFGFGDSTSGMIHDNRTPGGTGIRTSMDRKGDKYFNPRLYFRFVKTKFTKIEQEKLAKELNKLAGYVKQLKVCGQQAAYEETSRALTVVARELEGVALGVEKYVRYKYIEKFMKFQNLCEVVYFKKLEEFPRIIPKEIQSKLRKMKKNNAFDEYWVLYLDYTQDSKKIKSNKQKIKEKDPILFGRYKYDRDNRDKDARYYYIADWIDEACDLTLEKFIGEAEKYDKDFKVNETEVTQEFIDSIVKEVETKHERLKNTGMSNFRNNMVAEDEENKETPEENRRQNYIIHMVVFLALAGAIGWAFYSGYFKI